MLNVKKCVEVCVKKYGLSEKEALRIATTDNILLNIQELRYKYDDMQIGTNYPDWITPEEHLKMCYATVWKKYNTDFIWWESCEDVAHDLFIYSSIRIHTYKDKYQLNGLLLCRLKNQIRDYMQEESMCYGTRYDWETETSKDELYTNTYKQACKYNAISKNTTDVAELILLIESIKNTTLQGLLYLCGYFLANIQEFLEPLANYYSKCPAKLQRKLYELGKEDIYFCQAINKTVNNSTDKNITIGKILKVFGKRDKSYIYSNVLPYLKEIGLIEGGEVYGT